MISPRQLRNQIENFQNSLIENQLSISTNPPIVRPFPPRRDMLTWSGSTNADSYFLLNPFDINTYHESLSQSMYSVVLYDASLLQISIEFKRNMVVKYRYLYFPCPYQLTEHELELLRYNPISETLNDVLLARSVKIGLVTPIRFDYDPYSEKEYHASSHLTFNSVDCRVAARGPLRFSSFIQFVFVNFYKNLWHEFGFLNFESGEQESSDIKPEFERPVHLNW